MVCSYGLVMFATVIFPSFHSMSIVNPPRAFSPFMLPSFQVGGRAGSKEVHSVNFDIIPRDYQL